MTAPRFLWLIVIVVASAAACTQPVGAYTESVALTPAQLTWGWQAGPVFPNDEASRLGFEQSILNYQAYTIPGGFELWVRASVPTGGGGWPNANVSGSLSYSSSVPRAISYLTWEVQELAVTAPVFHDPEDGVGLSCPPAGMGDALYGAGPAGGAIQLGASKYSGGKTSYTVVGPAAWAVASYSYWNNEYITDYSEVKVRATISSLRLTFHWAELSISASSNESPVGTAIQFNASAKDGVSPYAFCWDFGDGSRSYDRSPSKSYAHPGSYTVTCTVTDSAGITDAKSLQVTINAYLTIMPSTGGSTNPSSGTYAYASTQGVSVEAFPSSGNCFSHWLLDGQTVPSNPISIFMDANHTLSPVFTAAPTAFDFSISKSGDVAVQRGGSGGVAVFATLLSGIAEQVSLSHFWTGSPPIGVSIGLSPLTIVPTATASLQVQTGSSASVGTYTLRIVGTAAGGLTRNVDVAVTITETQPPTIYYYLTVQPAEGGSTNLAPGSYRYEVGKGVTLIATPYPGYTFRKWSVNGIDYSSDTVQLTMNEDKIAVAEFSPEQQTQTTEPLTVSPCNIITGEQLDRVVVNENFGINVTGIVPGISSPSQVTVTAWLDPSGAVCHSEGGLGNPECKFSGMATTNASGWFTIAFGGLSSMFYSTNRSASLGSQHYAYAVVTVGNSNYSYNGTWKIDTVEVAAEFDYNLTGAAATFRFIFATDGYPLTGRSRYYMTSLEGAYSALVSGTLNASRLSTPCDSYGFARLYIPYEEMNASTLFSPVELPVWATLQDGSVFRASWLPTSRINYSVLAPVVYQFNATCIAVEAIDWGDRANLAGVPGVQLALYWDTYEHPFNGTHGLLGYYGPTQRASLVNQDGGTYIDMGALTPDYGRIPVDCTLSVPEDKVEAEIAVATYADYHGTIALGDGPDGLWLQLVPGHSSSTLYNPTRDGRILLVGTI
ncbi:MAG: InlB B-repeat-containing protein [Candidatus Methanosuratincola sp.]|nr:PKD domain-containing protein [Candidatus Methanosuratincola sp.]